ncbi:MAG: hypothetical protein AAFV93_07150 [Chloroflexota bacterium]
MSVSSYQPLWRQSPPLFWSLLRWILPAIWLALIGSIGLLEHSDWKTFFYPALEAYVSGDSPFIVEGIFSPPWFFMLMTPLVLLGADLSGLLIEYVSLVILYTGLLMFIRDGRRLLIGFILLSPLNFYVLNQIWLAQVDVLFTFTGIILTILVAYREKYYVWYAGLALLLLSLKPPSGIWIAFYLFYLVPIKHWWKMLLIPLSVGILSLVFDFDLILNFIDITLARLEPSERPVWDVTIIGVGRFYDLNGILIGLLSIAGLGWIVYLWRRTQDIAEQVMLVTIAGLLINAYVGWHHLILLFALAIPLLLRRSAHIVMIIVLVAIGFNPILRLFLIGIDLTSTLVIMLLLTVTQPYQVPSQRDDSSQ